jgi:hypothetical protein
MDGRMLKLLGLDAVTFLQYLRLLRWLTAAISILVAIPLVALNYYINTETEYGSSTTNVTTSSVENSTEVLVVLELLTAANVTGNGLYVHIFFECLITCLVCFFGTSPSACLRCKLADRGTFGSVHALRASQQVG